MTAPVPDKNTAKEALKHFVTAFGFLIVGIAALIVNSPRLSEGSFADARVIGGVHFITLGWLSLSIFGALRVFSGVALGRQGFALGLVPWIRRLWIAGVLFFPAGLIVHSSVCILLGALSIGIALLLFTIHIVPALVTAERGRMTRAYLGIAVISLWGTWLLGASAASIRAGSSVVSLPPGYLAAHILLAAFGWVGATIVGVGSHLIPMFALSRSPAQWPVKAALPLWGLIPVLAVIGAFHPQPFLKIAWMVAAGGSLLWLIQIKFYFEARLRKERDPGLFLAAGATVWLAIAWVIAAVANTPIVFVGLVVVGWLTLFTLGIYHRVIPFLVWYMRFAKNAGRGPVPKVKDLTDERLGMLTAVSALGGVAVWALGLYARRAPAAYIGAALIFCAVLAAAGQTKSLFLKPKLKRTEAPGHERAQ